MRVELNHTIVPSLDKAGSAAFIARILGLPSPRAVSHFVAVELSNGVTLDYDDAEAVVPQHYAFLVDEEQFDAVLQRVRDAGVEYFADARHRVPSEVNARGGGQGFYFSDPDGHNMEVFTKPPLG
jgi:catechol 2,3-dioxygenase-like lactoylglutathione lyase family enzyme